MLAQLSAVVPAARSLEDLTRPLLAMLAETTGMESTYLTAIDAEADLQHVRFARNADADFEIPEGLSVPWADTLCKRALDEGRPFTDDVAGCWGDSDAARALGIRTYVSAPIRGEGGELLGTLCAASPAQRPLAPGAEQTLSLFTALVGQVMSRDRLVVQLQHRNAELASFALTDPLTGLPNRRALVDELQRLLARGLRERSSVLVGMVDLDGFKAINDGHGHLVGDAFLKWAAGRLGGALRATDLLGRLGGDEFVVVGPGVDWPAPADGSTPGLAAAPAATCAATLAAQALQARCLAATVGRFELRALRLDYPGASAGVVAVDPRRTSADEALRLADAAMYAVKRARRSLPLAA